jgi:Flp pilus assembly protein TadG
MKRRTRKGSGIIEAVSVAIVLIMVAITMLDLIVLIIANSMNDTAAKNAARAAANQADGSTAEDAANKALESFRSSTLVTSLVLDDIQYAKATKDGVMVQTKMIVHLPMPFPGWSEMTFIAKDVEPIVNMQE